MRQRN